MKVPRAIALPIVLTVCTLTVLTAGFCFSVSDTESYRLEFLRDAAEKANTPGMTNVLAESELTAIKEDHLTLPLPSVTEFYFNWFGIGLLLPIPSFIVGYLLLRPSVCSLTALTWFVCLSVLAMVLWSLYCYLAVHVGYVAICY